MRPAVTTTEFSAISTYIEKHTGIALDMKKSYLVETRLGPLLEQLDCGSYGELLRRSKLDRRGDVLQRIVDAISTQETSFFRDGHPFELLIRRLVPATLDRISSAALPSLRIWCAACSTGQEVYSIAMSLKESLGELQRYAVRIVGTDIACEALAAARAGRYTRFEVERGIDAVRLRRHFHRDGDRWRINDDLRSITFFERANVLDSDPGPGGFDIIFCRNVAIYFTKENRQRLYRNLAERLHPEGFLVIGSTESLIGVSDRFIRREFLGSIYYEKAGGDGTCDRSGFPFTASSSPRDTPPSPRRSSC